jgi:hypothetical protein
MDSWQPKESSAKLTALASRTTVLVRGVKTSTALMGAVTFYTAMRGAVIPS